MTDRGLFGAIWVALALAAGLAGLLVHGHDRAVEGLTTDLRFAARGDRPPPAQVVVVALDDASLARLPTPPVPRKLDARVVERLHAAGAAVIAFDLALERPRSRDGDRALVAALAAARPSVVSVATIAPGGHFAPLTGRTPFGHAGVIPAATELRVDGDESVRRFPPSYRGVPSFALRAASAYLHRPLRTPPTALIDYRGPTGTVPALSFADVLDGRLAAREVRGKVVVIGPTAPVLGDRHRVPTDATMPGPEIQAEAIDTAIAGFPLRRLSPGWTAATSLLGGPAVLLVLFALVGIARGRLGGVLAEPPWPGAVAIAGTAVLALWLAGSNLLFARGTVTDVTAPATAIVLATALFAGAAAAARRRARSRARAALASRDRRAFQRRLSARRSRAGAGGVRDAIAGYTLEARIGQGGMGVVYRARDVRLDRDVAIKVIAAEHADDRDFRRRFVAEARLAAGLAHPHIVPIFDARDDHGLLYIVMPLIAGYDLGMPLRRGAIPEPPATLRYAHQVAGALTAAHAAGVVHRDLKPGNIMVAEVAPDHAYLLDFGLADRQLDLARRDPGAFEGTVDYVAPEQAAGAPGDARADVYALACVLFHCLTGSPPFPRATDALTLDAHRSASRPKLSDHDPRLAPGDEVVRRGMAIAPDDRFATPLELTGALRRALAGLAEAGPPRPRSRPPVSPEDPTRA